MKKINHKNRIMAFLLTVVMLVGLVSGTGVFNTSASEEGETTSVSTPADSATTSVPASSDNDISSSDTNVSTTDGKTAAPAVTATPASADEEAEESPFHQEIAILDDKESPTLTFTIDADEGVFPDGTIAVVKTIPADDDTSSPAMSEDGEVESDQLQGMPEYKDIKEKLNDEVEKSGKSISGFSAYDISFYNSTSKDTGGKLVSIEPQTGVNGNKAVKVSVSYTGEQSALKVDGDVSVYHLALSEDRTEVKEVKELTTTTEERKEEKEEAESVDAANLNKATVTKDEEKITGAEWTVDEFSVFAITTTSLNSSTLYLDPTGMNLNSAYDWSDNSTYTVYVFVNASNWDTKLYALTYNQTTGLWYKSFSGFSNYSYEFAFLLCKSSESAGNWNLADGYDYCRTELSGSSNKLDGSLQKIWYASGTANSQIKNQNVYSIATRSTGIAVSPSSDTMLVGSTKELTAVTTGLDASSSVTWSSSNTSVATVDTNGTVTGVAAGTATITASAGTYSATSSITVENGTPVYLVVDSTASSGWTAPWTHAWVNDYTYSDALMTEVTDKYTYTWQDSNTTTGKIWKITLLSKYTSLIIAKDSNYTSKSDNLTLSTSGDNVYTVTNNGVPVAGTGTLSPKSGISLTASPSSINIGAISTLTASAVGNFEPTSYTWSITSGTDYVTFDDGTTADKTTTNNTISVKGKAVGSATIKVTAKDKDNNENENTVSVTVGNYRTICLAIDAGKWGTSSNSDLTTLDIFLQYWKSTDSDNKQEVKMTYDSNRKVVGDDNNTYAIYYAVLDVTEYDRFLIGKSDNANSFSVATGGTSGQQQIRYQTLEIYVDNTNSQYQMYPHGGKNQVDKNMAMSSSGTDVFCITYDYGYGNYRDWQVGLKTLVSAADSVTVTLDPDLIGKTGSTTATAVLNPSGSLCSNVDWKIYDETGKEVTENFNITRGSNTSLTATIKPKTDEADYGDYTVAVTITTGETGSEKTVSSLGDASASADTVNLKINPFRLEDESVNVGQTKTLTLTTLDSDFDTTGVSYSLVDNSGTEQSTSSYITLNSSAGTVTGIAGGTQKVKASVTVGEKTYTSTATVTVARVVYFDATLSKLRYQTSTDVDNTHTMGNEEEAPNENKRIYFVTTNKDNIVVDHGWMTKVANKTIENNTYKDVYSAQISSSATKIAFSNASNISNADSTENQLQTSFGTSTGYLRNNGMTTGLVDLPTTFDNPCFYADDSENIIYHQVDNTGRGGYWDEVYSIRDAESGKSGDVVNTETNTSFSSVSAAASDTYYVNSTFYDYYSDYELNGNSMKGFWGFGTQNGEAERGSIESYYRFRQFDQALSDYYKDNGGVTAPMYTGHFQPTIRNSGASEDWGNAFAKISNTLNLVGFPEGDWTSANSGTTGLVNNTTYKNFMSTNNSTISYNGTSGRYPDAALGLAGGSDSNGIKMGGSNVTMPFFNTSFLSGDNSKNTKLGEVYNNVQFPFKSKTDENGVTYYEFDSAKETTKLVDDGTTKYLNIVDTHEDFDSGTNAGSSYNSGKNEWSMNVDSEGKGINDGVSTLYGFFPLNEISVDRGSNNYNYGFGTKLEFTFTLPSNGMATGYNNQTYPVNFQFSGDDDVWVFIDGDLILDIGGDHGRTSGCINFGNTDYTTYSYYYRADGKRNQENNKTVPAQGTYISTVKASATNTSVTDGQTYTDSNTLKNIISAYDKANGSGSWYKAEHTLTMYYMERGMWESNMMVRYSMTPKQEIGVQKNWASTTSDRQKGTVYAVLKRYLSSGGSVENASLVQVYSSKTGAAQYLIELNESNGWAQRFDLAKYDSDQNNPYVYVAYEVALDADGNPVTENNEPVLLSNGDVIQVSGQTYIVSGSGTPQNTTTGYATITNTRQPGDSYTIRKVWGISGTEADAAYFKLQRKTAAENAWTDVEVSGVTDTTTKAFTLNSTNNWTRTFTDLDKKDSSGNTYSYQFVEVTPDGTAITDSKIQLKKTENSQEHTYEYLVSSTASGNLTTITNTLSEAGFSLTKMSSVTSGNESAQTLSGVEFKLYTDASGSKSDTVVKFDSSATGTYTYSASGTVDTLVTDGSGKLSVSKLQPAVYWLQETKAAEGYNTLSQPIRIDLLTSHTASFDTARTNLTSSSGSITVGDDAWADQTLTFTVTNVPGYVLPLTGGTSGWNIWVYIIAGVAFLITILMQRKHAS